MICCEDFEGKDADVLTLRVAPVTYIERWQNLTYLRTYVAGKLKRGIAFGRGIPQFRGSRHAKR